MGFRQEKQGRLEWKKWLQRSRDVLVECGLPTEVYKNRSNWRYFLGHGYFSDYETGYSFFPEQLSPAQQQFLCNFLQAEFAEESFDPCALVVLKRMLGIPQRWQPPIKD